MPTTSKLASRRSRLDSAFSRVKALSVEDLEIRSDFARYLCVLVSGFVEKTVAELAAEYCRKHSTEPVFNFAEYQLGNLKNINSDRLLKLVGSFNPLWRDSLETFIEGARKEALNSVVNLRNNIAHGESVGVTFVTIQNYYFLIKEIIDHLETTFD